MPWKHGQRRPATREDVARALCLDNIDAEVDRHVEALAQAVNVLSFREWEKVIELLGVDSAQARRAWRLLAYPADIIH